MNNKSNDWDKISSIATFSATLIAALAVLLSYIQFKKSVELNITSINISKEQFNHQKKEDSLSYILQLMRLKEEHIKDSIDNSYRILQFTKTINAYNNQTTYLKKQYEELAYSNMLIIHVKPEVTIENNLKKGKITATISNASNKPLHIRYIFLYTIVNRNINNEHLVQLCHNKSLNSRLLKDEKMEFDCVFDTENEVDSNSSLYFIYKIKYNDEHQSALQEKRFYFELKDLSLQELAESTKQDNVNILLDQLIDKLMDSK